MNKQSCRYTPYHVPHRTEVAGFMTIQHGDARFYNNIFVQQEVPGSYFEHREKHGTVVEYNFVCGTVPYDGYPTEKDYLAQFKEWNIETESNKDRYYDHMPVWSVGNVYLNGAKPCDLEKDALVSDAPVKLELKEEDGKVCLCTDLYDQLADVSCGVISTETLGQAFEPEQKFESPNGDPIIFNRDYFDNARGLSVIPGPFASAEEAGQKLF